jgi:predicted membrane channel-forming protein YqfA (hemolysin III family)
MKKLTKKQNLRLSIVLLVIGIAFLIWGGFIYHHYEGMKEARIVMRHATWHAGLQYCLGLACILAGYFAIRKA